MLLESILQKHTNFKKRLKFIKIIENYENMLFIDITQQLNKKIRVNKNRWDQDTWNLQCDVSKKHFFIWWMKNYWRKCIREKVKCSQLFTFSTWTSSGTQSQNLCFNNLQSPLIKYSQIRFWRWNFKVRK